MSAAIGMDSETKIDARIFRKKNTNTAMQYNRFHQRIRNSGNRCIDQAFTVIETLMSVYRQAAVVV